MMGGQAELTEVVGTARSTGGLAHGLYGGQQQTDEHADDGDHHQEFNEREAVANPFPRRTHAPVPRAHQRAGSSVSGSRSRHTGRRITELDAALASFLDGALQNLEEP